MDIDRDCWEVTLADDKDEGQPQRLRPQPQQLRPQPHPQPQPQDDVCEDGGRVAAAVARLALGESWRRANFATVEMVVRSMIGSIIFFCPYIQYLVLGRSRIFRRCGCRSSKYLSFLPPPPQLLGTLPGSRTPNSPVSANTTTFHLDTAIRHLEQCIIVGFLSVPIGTNHHGKRMHDGHRAAKKIICHIRPNIQCVDPR